MDRGSWRSDATEEHPWNWWMESCFIMKSRTDRWTIVRGSALVGASIPISQWCMLTIPPICTKCINFSLLFLQNVYISPYFHKIDQFIPPISAQFIHFPLFPRNLLTYMHATEKNTCMPTYMFRAYVLQYLHSLPEYIHVHTWIHSITHMHASKHTPIHTSTFNTQENIYIAYNII